MDQSTFKNLLERYRAGKCTPAEKALVESWYNSLNKQHEAFDEDELLHAGDSIWNQIATNTGLQNAKKPKKIFTGLGIAATLILFVISAAAYLVINRKAVPLQVQAVKYNIVPGGNKAVLTLSNGRKINLNNAFTGKIAQQGNVGITKTADGKLLYADNQPVNKNDAFEANTIETPPGGQYEVNLPDGTRVWLNASSSLKYPVQFKGSERRVTLSGEAYFEVAPNKLQPFIVSSANQTVKVLGTHFNINAYRDEPAMVTTLLTGSVLIKQENTQQAALLKPGQQALVSHDIRVSVADEDEAIAWKNGMIKFTNLDIKSIMRMISRWYNVDVIYNGPIPTIGFGGSVSRSMNITEILKVLETTGYVHFKITGRSVIVMR